MLDFTGQLSRRRFGRCLGAAGLLGLSARSHAVIEDGIFTTVDTANGRLRGLVSGGIHVFKGVRYGADTSGANRFMAPRPVADWAGVRDATGYGNYAPQMPASRERAYSDLIMYDLQPGGMGEDCLVLNIWTPTTSRNAARPVLVHLHGGGYYAGSGNSPQFDGEMLARFGDAVVVTVNHRLGAFGFLDLAEFGDRYAQSGTAGMLDIVAALRWVRENIAGFGGDASRVLVFGQSGGGLKTSVLMAMPGAKGLFHRAGVMSGSALRLTTRAAAARTTQEFCRQLGIATRADAAQLHALPFQRLLAAQLVLEAADRSKGEAPRAFSPVMDGVEIPRHPFDPDAPAISANVPMIVGTVLDERAYRKENFDLDEAGLRRFADEVGGADGGRLLSMYREEDPTATPFVLQARIDTDQTFRRAAQLQVERKASQGAAPVYAYLWKVPSPAFEGRYGTPHGTDIGPSLHDVRNGLNGPTSANLRLADQLASAWVAFAANGDPNNPKTPAWPPYALPGRSTLVFEGDSSRTASQADPRRAFREYWSAR